MSAPFSEWMLWFAPGDVLYPSSACHQSGNGSVTDLKKAEVK
jgi:hypothetical protein